MTQREKLWLIVSLSIPSILAQISATVMFFIDANDPYGWEVVTEDEKPSAQWEHTLLMTDHGVEVLTY